MAVHILIPTLQGISAVQGIIREDADVPSVVCLNGSSQSLPISNAYYDFVKKGQGIIAREFGHPAWRIDLSEPVEMGTSWQLGLYLAHYFESTGQLGNGEPAANDTIIWATGAVKVNGDVEPVDGLERKIAQSKARFESWQALGVQTCVVMCAANQTTIKLPVVIEAAVERITINSVADLSPLLSVLNLGQSTFVTQGKVSQGKARQRQSKSKPSPLAAKRPDQTRQTKKLSFAVVAVIVVITIAVSAYSWYQERDKQPIAATVVEPIVKSPVNTVVEIIDETPVITTDETTVKLPTAELLPAEVLPAPQKEQTIKANNSKPLMLVSRALPSQDCASGKRNRQIFSTNHLNHFEPQSMAQLCDIRFDFGEQSSSGLWMYALDTGALLKLKVQEGQWILPLPEQQQSNRRAILLRADYGSSATAIPQLKRFLDINVKNEVLNAQQIQRLLASSGLHQFSIYGFLLETF